MGFSQNQQLLVFGLVAMTMQYVATFDYPAMEDSDFEYGDPTNREYYTITMGKFVGVLKCCLLLIDIFVW